MSDPGKSESRLPAKTEGKAPSAPASALAGLADVKVKVALVLGRTEITFDDAVNLDVESLLTIDRTATDPVDVCINGEVVARGKLVVVGDNYGVQITELVVQGRRRG